MNAHCTGEWAMLRVIATPPGAFKVRRHEAGSLPPTGLAFQASVAVFAAFITVFN